MTDYASDEGFSPCRLVNYQGRFSLLCVAFDDDFIRRAEQHKGQGGGHTLQAMVEAAMELEAVTLPSVVFDSEAGMFAVRGEKDELRVLAGLVKRLLSDADFADKVIAHSVEQGNFD